MTNNTLACAQVNANAILIPSPTGENFKISPAGNPCQQGSSQTPNNCSVPKSIENNTENIEPEKVTNEAYAERRQKCMEDIQTVTGKALNLSYPKEYKAWSNSKSRSKNLKDITGPKWGAELDTFPGFLKHTGPSREVDDSLDRIDPSYGYVIGNLRWASKQLQSENRKNVEMILVRGVPMTKRQLAGLLGITYDALRMRLHRGESIEDILAKHLKGEIPAAKSVAAKIEACPWPEGKEEDWEAAYQAERRRLLQPEEQNSRTAFFVAKCNQKLRSLNEKAREYAESFDPNEPIPVDLDFSKNHEFWTSLRKLAWEQRDLVLKERAPRPYRLEPSDEELAMIEGYRGAPPAVTAEDMYGD